MKMKPWLHTWVAVVVETGDSASETTAVFLLDNKHLTLSLSFTADLFFNIEHFVLSSFRFCKFCIDFQNFENLCNETGIPFSE